MMKTAGQKAKKALEDSTKYKNWEVAYGMVEDVGEQLLQAAQNYEPQIDQNEFCLVYVNGSDPLIPNVIRRKYYCWPWLPSPRPDQGVFLYNKSYQAITKRLWVLPPPHTMAELASCTMLCMAEPYKNMQRWSKYFFEGSFFSSMRKEHGIEMLSQQEFFEKEEKIASSKKFLSEKIFKNVDKSADEESEPVFDFGDSRFPESFDFSKISTNQLADTT